jgi:ribokinase
MTIEIAVVGSINMDLVVRTPALPLRGETVIGGSFEMHPGGKGANQAVAASRCGAAVSLVGAVGDDAHGCRLLELLGAEGVSIDGVLTMPGLPTGVALITVEASSENTIVVAAGANSSLTAANVEAHADRLSRADALIIQLEIPLDPAQAAAAIARRAGRMTVLNAAPARPLPSELLSITDVLIVNRSEAAILAGSMTEATGEQLIEVLLGLGCRRIALTLGRDGALFHDGATLHRQSAFAVDSIDSTAAGDAFVGALTVALCEGRPAAEALRLAAAAGALATTVRGAQPSLPRRPAIERLAAGLSPADGRQRS